MNPNLNTGNKHLHINTNGTVIVPVPANPVGKLILIALVINTKGASSNTASIYDSTQEQGEVAENLKAVLDTTVIPGRFEYNIPIENGIYIEVETGTAPDLTLIWAETA